MSIEIVGEGEEDLCGWCLDGLSDAYVVCGMCGGKYHHSCWSHARRCAISNCKGQPLQGLPAPVATIPMNVTTDVVERVPPAQPSSPSPSPAPITPGFHWGAALLGPIWGFAHGGASGLRTLLFHALLWPFGVGWLAPLLIGMLGWDWGWREHASLGGTPMEYVVRERAWNQAGFIAVGLGLILWFILNATGVL
ncbi:hypothetical protein H8D30_05395 [bacterium]|nr:hypothetical protein [bacterium]